MRLGMEIGDDIGPGDVELVGNSAPQKQIRGTAPQFSAHVYCSQSAGWIKMQLGMEVGLGPGDFVLDGNPAPPKKGTQPPNFRPISVVAKRLGVSGYHLLRR